jgi:hypothetical protein
MSSMGGERKIATMVFADLVGSTELAASSRQAWIEAGRRPLGAFATLAACAAAIYGCALHHGRVEEAAGQAQQVAGGASGRRRTTRPGPRRT